MQEEYKDSHLFNSQNENISEIILPQEHNDIISGKLVDTFSIRLSQLEESYKEKDADISSLMYKLHAIILSGLDIKTKIPPVKVFGKKNFSSNNAEDNLNRSNISTISRRSISVSKAGNTKQFGKVEPKDKMAKFSQKAAINICSSQSQDSNINRTILSKSPNRDAASNNQQKPKVVQNKFNNKSNSLKVADSNNKRAINKSDDKQTKFISSNNIKSPLIHTNTYDAKKAKETQNHEVNKPLRRKTNSDDLKTNNNNQKLNTSNNQITKTSTEISQVSKNHSGKYHSTSATSSSDIFVNNNNNNKTVNYKFKPKKKLLGTIEKESKFLKLLSTKNSQKVFGLLCKFCNYKEQFSLKNFSKNARKMYFHNLISELNDKIKQVNKKNELHLEMEIPKILEMKINKENLYLSKYKETYRINNSFLNMINILYLLTHETVNIDWSKTLDEKVYEIEEFTKSFDPNLNFYKAMKEITHKIKTSNTIFETLMKNTSNIKFVFTGLCSAFTPLAEYLLILNKSFLNNCNNMEMKIDIEIIDHKIDILKTLSDNF
jgi:hypothetical protein